MSYPTTFANLTAGNEPAALLDTMFNIVGNMAVIGCSASGTNAITLTPNTNFFLPASYVNYQGASFVAAATSTGAVTVQIGGLGFKNVYRPDLTQAAAGDVAINTLYVLAFNSALASGAGGFQIVSATGLAVQQTPTRSLAQKSIVQVTGATTINISADELVLEAPSNGSTIRQSAVSATITITNAGANGLDTGALASNTWYYVFGIWNPTSSTFAGIISLSSTIASLTLPTNYTFAARIGAVRNATSPNLQGTIQRGNTAQYMVGVGATTTIPVLATGSQGDPNIPTFVSTATTALVPTTVASGIRLYGAVTATGTMVAAPNASYGGASSANAPPLVAFNNAAGTTAVYAQWLFEGATTVQYASNVAGSNLFVLGWTDTLPAG